eukprot:symbB.v1.2.012607.t1/scaffold874.1/size155782/1
MAALDALAQERLRRDKDDRSSSWVNMFVGEDGLVSQVDTHPAPADLGMVVFEPVNLNKGKGGKDSGLPPLPDIFGKITGKTPEKPNVENKECEEAQRKVYAEEPSQAPKLVRLPSSQALKKGTKSIQDVLDLALGHIPLHSKKPAPKEKAKAKAKAKAKGKTKAQPKNAAAKAKQAKEKKVAVEKPAKEQEAEQPYQAGDYAANREKYIQDLMRRANAGGRQHVSHGMGQWRGQHCYRT